MELLLTDSQTILKDAAERFCKSRGGAARVKELRAAGLPMDADAWREIAEAGWLGILASEPAGGLDLGLLELLLFVHEVGYRWLDIPLAPVALSAAALGASATAEGRLQEVLNGRLIVVPALDGDGTSFEPHGALPRAVLVGNELRLTGVHRFVPHVATAHSLLVLAETPDREHVLCPIDRDRPGVAVAMMPCADGTALSDVTLQDAIAPAETIVARGEDATLWAERIRTGLLIAVSTELVGVGANALDLALDHVKLRHQFGKPIGSFQALQHRLVNGHVGLELAHALAFRAAGDVDGGKLHPATVPALKAKAGSAVLEMVRTALQVHGAIGYTDDHTTGRLFRRALTLNARYGNENYQYAQFARLSGANQPMNP
jgi:alkylation response protein AidB-like acyl-CoA dehydrogenase